MDVANVRLVAILVGRGEAAPSSGARAPRRPDCHRRLGALRGHGCLGTLTVAREHVLQREPAAPPCPRSARRPVTIPFAALAFTYMGATRGLTIMRYTLYSQWTAQPIGWIVFTLGFWAICAARPPAAAGWAFGAVVGVGARDRRVRLAEGTAPVPARAHGRGPSPEERTGPAPALRGPARPRHAVLAADLLDRPVRALAACSSGQGVAAEGQVGVYSARAAGRTGVVPVPRRASR